MRSIVKSGILFLLFLSIIGCNKKSDIIQSRSEDDNLKIQVFGVQKFIAEPWQTTISIQKGNEEPKAITLGLYTGNELNKEDVKFEWEGNTQCIISLSQTDEMERRIIVVLDNDRVKIKEI